MEEKKKVVVAFSGGLDTSFTVMIYLLSLSQESLRNDIKRKIKKNFRKRLAVKIKPLTFAPAFETKATKFFEILINNTSSTRKK